MKRASAVQRLLFVSIGLCLVAGIITFNLHKAKDQAQFWVDHTNIVIDEASRLLIDYKDSEISKEIFILKSDSSQINIFRTAVDKVNSRIVQLRELTIDNPQQTALIDHQLKPVLTARINELTQSIVRGANHTNDYRADIGAVISKEIEKITIDLIKREKNLLQIRTERYALVSSITEFTVYGLLLVIAISIAMSTGTITRFKKNNTALLISLQRANDTLEAKVHEQTGHLRNVNEDLQNRNKELVALNEELRSSEEEVKANLEYISALKRDLEKSEQLHRLLTENSQDIIAVFSPDNRFSYISPAVQKVLGFRPSELIGRPGVELIHPLDVDKLQPPNAFIKNGGKIVNPHFRLRRKDGAYVWIEAQSNPILDDDGKVIGIQTINRDITFRKEAEEALAESERKYRLVSENSSDVIAVCKPDGHYTFVSPAVEELLGYSPAELIGRKSKDFIHPEDFYHVASEESAHLKNGQSVLHVQYRMRKKDKSYIWVESSTKAVRNNAGEIVAIQMASRDITIRKQAEQALKDAKEKAEEATKAKSQFLSMMSHEIRTPMNAVIGLTNILIEQEPRNDQMESLKLLKFSGESLLTIINDILDFSKIEAGKITLEKINYNLEELLRNCCAVQRKRADEKKIQVFFEIDKAVPHVILGDPFRVTQVVTNLLNNAIKFTERGYVELHVTAARIKDQRHRLVMSFKDTGIGIEENKLKYIFEGFSQANADTTRKFGGTGLGLAISLKLVEMMGGSINVRSLPGHGSTFTVEFETVEGVTDLEKTESQKLHSKPIVPADAKILIVEDNRVNQIVVFNFLRHWSLKADFADNGTEALSLIRNKSYKLVLMDLQMPEMDGYTAARKIRQIEGEYFKTIPIIALTASAMIDIKEKAVSSGMNDYISKPFNPEELKTKILSYLNVDIGDAEKEKSWAEAFNLYTEGNPELKRQMAELLMANIRELQRSIALLSSGKVEESNFAGVAHKCKTTLRFLGDPEFENVIESIVSLINASNYETLPKLTARFEMLSEKLIAGLKEEIASS